MSSCLRRLARAALVAAVALALPACEVNLNTEGLTVREKRTFAVTGQPDLTLEKVFESALAVVGPERILFGTDSSFFPRGWHRAIYNQQRAALIDLGVSDAQQAAIFGGNFERLFGRA